MCQVTTQRELVTSPNTPLCLLSSPCQSHCHCLDCSIANQGHALLYLQEDMMNFRIQYSLVSCCWGYSLPEFPYVVQGIPFKTRTDLSTQSWGVLEKLWRFRILCSSRYVWYVVLFWTDCDQIIAPEVLNLTQTPDSRTKSKKDVTWLPVDRCMCMNVYAPRAHACESAESSRKLLSFLLICGWKINLVTNLSSERSRLFSFFRQGCGLKMQEREAVGKNTMDLRHHLKT